jgi:hypothetical protein
MASRSKSDRRPEPGGDSLEALKPLIVLVLFGTILYGAYSVVQKGPRGEAERHADAPEAPAFAPPAVEVPQQPAMAAQPAAAPANPAAPPVPEAIAAAAQPETVEPPLPTPPAPPAAAGSHAASDPVADELAVGAAAAGLAAAAASAAAEPVAPASSGPPTILAAESAAPPAQEDVAALANETAEGPPQRLASTADAPPAALPVEMPPPPSTLPSSAAFATAWADAHEKLGAGRFAEALTALSVWYDDPSLGLEESHRLEDLLGQLAGTVIYSQQDLLLPPHVVAPGETLPAIAAPLGVSWQLLAKINGVDDPMRLLPGEHLKLVRGPFDGVVSIARRRLSLQVNGAYAGSFPIVVGRDFLARVGTSLPVAEVRRAAPGQSVQPGLSGSAIVLGEGLVIEGVDDPAGAADDAAPASLVVSARDLDDLLDILGPGSSILVRQ